MLSEAVNNRCDGRRDVKQFTVKVGMNPNETESSEQLERYAKCLEASGDYQVLRRIKAQQRYGAAGGDDLGSVCFIDFETTGTGKDDKPIEIGLVRVAYDRLTCEMGQVLDRYGGLEDPGFEVPKHIELLTGINTKMIKGQRFDDEAIERIVSKSSFLIAHHAEFDREQGEKRWEIFARKPWGCSMLDVPWAEGGFKGKALEYLVMQAGAFHKAHRAEADAEVIPFMLQREILDGHNGLWHVLQVARSHLCMIWATNSPFSAKEKLQERGYSWKNGVTTKYKGWAILTDNLDAELRWLAQDVYGGRGGMVMVANICPYDRFTNRTRDDREIDLTRLGRQGA